MIRIVSLLLALVACLTTAVAAQHSASSNSFVQAESDARKFQLAPGLKLEVWAAEPQLENPVAFSLVPGPALAASAATDQPVTAYIAETHRFGISILDITQNTPWLLNDLSFRTVGDRVRFLTNRFSTNVTLLTRDSEIVRRVADTTGSHRADSSDVFATGFQSVADGTAAGVLARGTNVWFANIPNLWRLTPGDPASVTTAGATRGALATGFGVHIGVTGHDLHGLTLGPEGRVYMSFGDRGICVTNREGLLLDVPDTGGVLRCEPDGRDLQIFCVGLRNPQELTFDDAGNLFTVDNDTAGADDCRVLHLVEGGDYGWRVSYQHMKGFGPWVNEGLWRGDLDGTLPLAGSVSQGPAGLTFYPGTGFGGRFNGRFIHCDFPGGIWSFSLRSRGATFRVDEKQKLLWNCWPTDVEFGPDGALYVLDWVAGWEMPKRGRIYRITPDFVFTTGWIGPAAPKTSVDLTGAVYEILRDGLAKKGDAHLLALLGHQDYRVRIAAQHELADRGPASLRALSGVIRDASEVAARRHALWAMGQILRRHPPNGSLLYGDELAAVDDAATDVDADTRIQALRVLGDFSAVNHRKAVGINLERTVPGDRVRFEARIAAARMAAPAHREAILVPARQRLLWRIAGATHTTAEAQRLGLLDVVLDDYDAFMSAIGAAHQVAVDDDPFERFSLAFAMTPLSPREIAQHVATRRHQPELFVLSRRAGLSALRRAGASEISNFLSDPDPRLMLEAARAINDVPIPEAYPALASLLNEPAVHAWGDRHALALQPRNYMGSPPMLPTNGPVARPARDQVLLRSLNAHFRIGQDTNAVALAEFASSSRRGALDISPGLRAEALFLLGSWEVPAASPGNVPFFPKADPNHGAVPSINPEDWPGWFDRVVGLWRPLPPRSADLARRILRPYLDAILVDADSEVALAALDAAVKLRITSAAPLVLARLNDPRAHAPLRRRVPSALASLQSPLLTSALVTALADADGELQAAAFPYLDRLEGSQGALLLAEKLGQILEQPTPAPTAVRLGQAALGALGRMTSADALPPLRDALDRSGLGKLAPELEFELTEAARRHNDDPAIRTFLERRDAALPHGDVMAASRELLVGGDSARGRSVFFEKPETQCSRCHKIRGEGGIVGPALDGIATRRDRRYLLESILLPNAQIAQGFDNVLLALKDGREFAGTVRSEDDDRLVLATVDAGEVRLEKSMITDRRRGLSAMPEGLGEIVPRRDLRDLVEFLAGLK